MVKSVTRQYREKEGIYAWKTLWDQKGPQREKYGVDVRKLTRFGWRVKAAAQISRDPSFLRPLLSILYVNLIYIDLPSMNSSTNTRSFNSSTQGSGFPAYEAPGLSYTSITADRIGVSYWC
jgi:hypothetical protein